MTLRGCNVLVLEDKYFLADQLEWRLGEEGATVFGPFASLKEVMDLPLDQVDGAILNNRVRDGLSYPFAQKLRERGIPFVFVSDQDRLAEPKEWHNDIWVPKPYEARELIAALLRVIGARNRTVS